MFVVALLTGPSSARAEETEAAASRIARALGVTAYEARLAIAGGFPAILLSTVDEAKTRAVLATLRGGGDDAVACDGRAILSADAMVPLDHFAFEERAVVAGGQTLPYDDVLCLVRAVHRARASTETKTTERKFAVGKSLLSGGLANSKVVTTTSKEGAESREQVLYVFRRSGETPWILRESRTGYEGLGAARGLTATANFATTVQLLRQRAPQAPYDERLMHPHKAPEASSLQGTGSRSTVTTSSAGGVDMLAHLVALSFAR